MGYLYKCFKEDDLLDKDEFIFGHENILQHKEECMEYDLPDVIIPADQFYRQELRKLLNLDIEKDFKKIKRWEAAQRSLKQTNEIKAENRRKKLLTL